MTAEVEQVRSGVGAADPTQVTAAVFVVPLQNPPSFACAGAVGVIFPPFTPPAPYPFLPHSFFFFHTVSLFLPKAKFSDSFQ